MWSQAATAHLRDAIERCRATKITVAQALEAAARRFPDAKAVKVETRSTQAGVVVEVLSLREVFADGKPWLKLEETRLDLRDGRLIEGEGTFIDHLEAVATMVAFKNFSRDLPTLATIVQAAAREAPDGRPVLAHFAGTESEPLVCAAIGRGDDIESLLFDARSARLVQRAQWSEVLRRTADLLSRQTQLDQSFDPAAGDSYADEASLVNVRKVPGGEEREMTLSGAQVKAMLPSVMPLAKARGDRNSCRDIQFRVEGCTVHVTATRHSELKNYDSPISWVVGTARSGRWLILEERSESRP
jgi:hypothetical protein